MNLNKKALAILSAAHFVTDINQGALPALLPFFKEALNLSYTTAGAVLLSANITSSIIQPAFGHLSDRRPIGWFLPLSPLIACLGLSLSGLVSNYSILLICVMVSGIGIASFHPEGFKTAYYFTGDKKATGMSIFAVGGNFGIATGPILALTLVTSFGLKGIFSLILPGILIAVILILNMSIFTAPVELAHREAKKLAKVPLTRNQKVSFSLLVAIATIRAWIQFGLATYIPFYYIDYLKGNPLYAGKLVSTFLLAGALGTLLGAPLADRWGHKRFLLISLALSFPLLLLFYFSSGLITFVFLGDFGNGINFYLRPHNGDGSGTSPPKSGNRFWDDGRIYHQCRRHWSDSTWGDCRHLGGTDGDQGNFRIAFNCIWPRLVDKVSS